ncbi:MAG: LLM class flavin-dependent oxidoreductase [Gammaproteobacteria bacterium]
MKHAIYVPNFGDYGEPGRIVALAEAAEASGYDGLFLWDHLVFDASGELDVTDATVALAAVAQATERLRIGAMVTPVARRRPWKLARELVALDRLSNGRATLGVGLGEPAELEFAAFGEDPAGRTRAQRLDEGLGIIDGLWRGEPVAFAGKHYRVASPRFAPPPVQRPRVPIWVAAMLPATAGLRRAARWDGVFPLELPPDWRDGDGPVDWSRFWLGPAQFAELVEAMRARRGVAAGNFDFLASGALGAAAPGGGLRRAFAEAGATWWLDWVDERPGSFDATLAAVERGPRD